jgi:hypothetical protein
MAATKYSDEEKAKICADWALLGDDKAVSDKHGVKLGTLKKWRQQAWWLDLLQTMQSHQSARLIAKANRAMDTALDQLEDRLYRGDMRCLLKPVKDPETGEVDQQVVSYREPVKARDLSAVINVLATRSEKAQALSNQTEQQYQLSDLQASFRQFATSYRAKQVGDSTAIEHETGPDQTVTNGLIADHGAIDCNADQALDQSKTP